jgi:hypothetical protein
MCADPHAVVRDREPPGARGRFEAHDDCALGPLWKGVFERIDHKFGGDQAHADGLLGCRRSLAGLDPDGDRLIVQDHRCGQALAQPRQIIPRLDLRSERYRVQLLLDRRDRHDPFMRVSQVLADFFRLNRLRLQQQDARDDLKTVVDPMVHLFEKKILLPQQLVLLAFQGAALRDVFDRHQQPRAVVALIKDLSGIQQHRAVTDRRKILLDLIRLDRRVARDDFLEERAQ